MPELHLKQPEFTYSACEPSIKHHERILKFRETLYLKHLYRNGNELDKKFFAHDPAYYDGEDLAKKTTSDNILIERAYEVAGNHNFDEYQKELASMSISKFLGKKKGLGISVNEQLAKDLHKPIITKFKRIKVYARFKGNIWAAELAAMESLSTKNHSVKHLLCVIDVSTKCAWV